MSQDYTNEASGGGAASGVDCDVKTVTVDYGVTSGGDHRGNGNLAPAWQRGQSGNPAGRPPGTGPTEALVTYTLTGQLPPQPWTPAWKIAKSLADRASEGVPRVAALVLDRVDGKVPDRVQVGLLQGVTLLPSDQLDAETWGRLYAHGARLGLTDATAVPALPAVHEENDAK